MRKECAEPARPQIRTGSAPHVNASHAAHAVSHGSTRTDQTDKRDSVRPVHRRRATRHAALLHLGILALFGVYAAAGALALATDDSAGATALCCVAGFAFIVGLLMWEASR